MCSWWRCDTRRVSRMGQIEFDHTRLAGVQLIEKRRITSRSEFVFVFEHSGLILLLDQGQGSLDEADFLECLSLSRFLATQHERHDRSLWIDIATDIKA